MRLLTFFFLVALTGCSDTNKTDISSLLDLRNAAISNQDLNTYSSLLLDTYRRHEGAQVLIQIHGIFSRFKDVRMTSRDRKINVLNKYEAICEQTYVLRLFADGKWREMIQREQLHLQQVNGHWKISGGL